MDEKNLNENENKEVENVAKTSNILYYILPIYNDVCLPGVEQNISVSTTYDRNLFRKVKPGDKIVVARALKQNCFSPRPDGSIVLPGVMSKAVICNVKNIDEAEIFTNVLVQGEDIINVVKPTLDTLNSLVACEIEFVPYETSEDVSSKYSAFNNFKSEYDSIRKKFVNNSLPPLPDYTDIQIDLIPFRIAEFLDCTPNNKCSILDCNSTVARFKILIGELDRFNQDGKIDLAINAAVTKAMEKNQREFILRERAKAVRNMLKEFDGDDQEEVYQKIIDEHPERFPPYILEAIKQELSRIKGLPSISQETNLIKTYLDLLVNLPYYKSTKDNDNIAEVKKILDEDHYGLIKQKDRILQYLAVKQMTNSLKSPIICLYGPPGVGKTSLGISIARALGRKFEKVSLGGVHDESEIRGHRRTYLGALPGKILTAIKKANVNNPVILLDEIDKVKDGGYHGNPASALLEVLDPEQNSKFEDNYLGHPFDLSNVLFICTANDIYEISAPLLDRLEMIPLYSYTKFEKMHIAKEYIFDIEYKNNGLNKDMIHFTDEALDYIIEFYTREAGVRNLQRQIGTIMRKFAVKYLQSDKKENHMEVTVDIVKEFLGKEVYRHDKKVEDSQVGVVNGLAYTDAGGEVLPIEVNVFPGKGNLIRTGNLGDVMKESCIAALTYIKTNAHKFGIEDNYFEEHDIHIHFPDTATPKDGPSAGIATVVVLLSAILNVKVRNDVGMTGEVDLRGNAMPIGGLREKTLAALREHIKKVLVPSENHFDVLELPDEVKNNIEIVEVKTMEDVIKHVYLEDIYEIAKTKKSSTKSSKKNSSKKETTSKKTSGKKATSK